MIRTLCKSKIHGATVTEANLRYAGSVTIDADLLQAAGLVPYEQVHLLDLDNGARLVTYCIEGKAGSGVICANGAAAHLVQKGDKVIIIAYGQFNESEMASFAPKILLMDGDNRVEKVLPETVHAEAPDGRTLKVTL